MEVERDPLMAELPIVQAVISLLDFYYINTKSACTPSEFLQVVFNDSNSASELPDPLFFCIPWESPRAPSPVYHLAIANCPDLCTKAIPSAETRKYPADFCISCGSKHGEAADNGNAPGVKEQDPLDFKNEPAFPGPLTIINFHESFCLGMDGRMLMMKLFLAITSLGTFLELMAKCYWRSTKVHYLPCPARIRVMMYLTLFHLDNETFGCLKETFIALGPLQAYDLLSFLINKISLDDVKEMAIRLFETQFVDEYILAPLEGSKNYLKKMSNELAIFMKAQKELRKKPLTVAVAPHFTERPMRLPKPEMETVKTPCIWKQPFVRPPPRTTYEPFELKGRSIKELNEESKLQFLAEIFKDYIKGRPEELAPPPVTPQSGKLDTYLPLPVPAVSKARAPVKPTATTILREGARLKRKQLKDLEKLESLARGGPDVTMFEKMQAEIRMQFHQEELEAIERKHLQGLITHEEALLARQTLFQKQKLKALAVRNEKRELEKCLQDIKEEEDQRLRALVEKNQHIAEITKEKINKMKESKCKAAREIIKETKERMAQVLKEREEELSRRIDLISEIRSIQEMKKLKTKDIDFTESPGYGLLCEMSLAELRERLKVMKERDKEDMEQKKVNAKVIRKQQKLLVKNTENFINQQRTMRFPVREERPIQDINKNYKQSEELQALRQKLYNMKQKNIFQAYFNS